MTELDEKTVEAAARKIFAECFRGVMPWGELHPAATYKTECRNAARAAILAFLEAEREAGRAMMPRQPSIEMIEACINEAIKRNPQISKENAKVVAWDGLGIWRAMFDAFTSPAPNNTGDRE